MVYRYASAKGRQWLGAMTNRQHDKQTTNGSQKRECPPLDRTLVGKRLEYWLKRKRTPTSKRWELFAYKGEVCDTGAAFGVCPMPWRGSLAVLKIERAVTCTVQNIRAWPGWSRCSRAGAAGGWLAWRVAGLGHPRAGLAALALAGVCCPRHVLW